MRIADCPLFRLKSPVTASVDSLPETVIEPAKEEKEAAFTLAPPTMVTKPCAPDTTSGPVVVRLELSPLTISVPVPIEPPTFNVPTLTVPPLITDSVPLPSPMVSEPVELTVAAVETVTVCRSPIVPAI